MNGTLEQLRKLAAWAPWSHQAWMLTTPRTGSTWLCRLLNKAVGLPEWPSLTGQEIINRRVWGEHPARGVDPRCCVVSKLMVEQAQSLGLTVEDRPTRLIYLVREDEAEQAASQMCLAQRGRATAPTDAIRDRLQEMPIEWSDAVGHHYIGRVRIENHYIRTQWLAPDVLTVKYEALCEDTHTAIADIMAYLEVDDYQLNTEVAPRKIGSPPEIVENMRRLLVMHETGKYAS